VNAPEGALGDVCKGRGRESRRLVDVDRCGWGESRKVWGATRKPNWSNCEPMEDLPRRAATGATRRRDDRTHRAVKGGSSRLGVNRCGEVQSGSPAVYTVRFESMPNVQLVFTETREVMEGWSTWWSKREPQIHAGPNCCSLQADSLSVHVSASER
jgi:hypothetical protein